MKMNDSVLLNENHATEQNIIVQGSKSKIIRKKSRKHHDSKIELRRRGESP